MVRGEGAARKDHQMKTQDQASTSTEAAAVAAQGAPLAPKKAASTKAASLRKSAPKAKKSATNTTTKKTVAKATRTMATDKVSAKSRAASKKMQVLDMLRAKGGATLDQLMAATGWQRHTCRGFLSIAGKSMKIVSEKVDGTRTYRIGGK